MSIIENMIRYLETNILDEEYKNYKLIYRPEELGLFYLLQLLGDIWRKLVIEDGTEFSYFQMSNTIGTSINGVGHCIRWFNKGLSHKVMLPDADRETLFEEASSLLVWSQNYSKLCQDHVAWSKKMMNAEVDEIKRKVTFYPNTVIDQNFMFKEKISEEMLWDRYIAKMPIAELRNGFKRWINEFNINGQLLEVSVGRELFQYELSRVLEWLKVAVYPDLPPETNFKGYTLRQFRKLFAALFLNCQYYTWFEDSLDRSLEYGNSMGSKPIFLSAIEMEQWLSEISGVSITATRSIMMDLMFDKENFHSNLTNQPFIKSNRGNIFVLPRLIVHIDPERMLSGAINKSYKKGVYAKLINVLEQKSLTHIENKFKLKGIFCLREKSFINKYGLKITPDLILYNIESKQVLIIEYKHFLSPTGTAETIHKINEYEKGVKQLQNYIGFVKDDLNTLNPWINNLDDSYEIYGLFLTRWPMPIPINTTNFTLVENWTALKEHLENGTYSSLPEMINLLVAHNTNHGIEGGVGTLLHDIQVSDWTYSRIYYVLNEMH